MWGKGYAPQLIPNHELSKSFSHLLIPKKMKNSIKDTKSDIYKHIVKESNKCSSNTGYGSKFLNFGIEEQCKKYGVIC